MRIRFGQRTGAELRRLQQIEERTARMLESRAFGAVCPDLWLEAGVDGGDAVLRAEEPALLPLLDHLVRRFASRAIPLSAAPPVPLDVAMKRALGVADFARANLRAGFSRGHLLEVVLGLPGGSGSDQELGAAQRLVFDLLGQRRAHAWLGRVSVVPAPRGGPLKVIASGAAGADPGSLSVADLVPTFEAAIRGVYEGLPDVPHAASAAQEDWSLFELDPEPGSEYAAQDDLVFASTCVPEALKCYLAGLPFASERFSRCGERFFYIKYRSSGAPEARLARRQQLEDRLDGALTLANAGRVVGAGLGLTYSYVHCALSALEAGLTLMAEAARDCQVSRQAWLLPFDAEFGEEWLEVWPNADPPPC